MPVRVLIVGHVTHDRYGEQLMPGGCAYYGALGYKYLGADVHLRCTVGRDFAHDAQLAKLPRSVSRGGLTTAFTNLYPVAQPRIQWVQAQAPEVLPDFLTHAVFETDLVHLAPVLGEVDLVRWKRRVRARILAISVQGYIKQRGPALASQEIAPGVYGATAVRGYCVVPKPWCVTVDELRGVDVACASDEDLIGQGNLLDRLREAIPTVALTHGIDGATVFHRGRVIRVGIVPEVVVADVTGAGDIFAAGFLYGLTSGKSIEAAGRLAAAAASIVIEARAAEALPRLVEASERALKVSVQRDQETNER